MNNENLTTEEAAKYLCVSLSKLWKMCHRKEVKYYKVGRLNLFKVRDLQEFIDAHRVLTKDELEKSAEGYLLKAKKENNYGKN